MKNRLHGVQQKTIERALVACILLLYVLLQLPTLDSVPWEGYDTWRQSDTYSIAVNYVQYNMNPLRPQFNYDGVADIYVQLELQIVPYITALIFRLTGQMTPVVPRLLSLALFVGSAVFLYLIARRFAGVIASLAGLCVYLLLPISLLYSRAIMPEACALFFYCGGVYFLIRWYADDHRPSVYLSAVFTAIAIVEKTPTIFVGILILAVFWWKLRGRCLRSREFYLFGVISLGFPLVYYVYASHVATMSYVDGIASKHIFTSELFSLFTPASMAFFQNNLPTLFGWVSLAAAGAGLIAAILRKKWFLVVWAAAFLAEWATIVVVIKFGYYLIFMAPVVGVLCAVLTEEIAVRQKIAGVCCGLLVIGLIASSSIPYWRSVTAENYLIHAVAQLIDEVTEPEDTVAVAAGNPVYLNAANRRGYRANIQYHPHIPTGPEAETQYYIEQGVSYFVVIGQHVNQDATGEYLDFLNNTFPIVAENDYCAIYAMG